MSIIKPSVGRKVWYRPCANDLKGPVPMNVAGPYNQPEKAEPLDATVIAVWGDRMVSVLVTDIVGRQFPVLSVDLLQPGDKPKTDAEGNFVGRYVEWMPYQVGQAAAQSPATTA
jgi:hypothetical protein